MENYEIKIAIMEGSEDLIGYVRVDWLGLGD